MKGTIKSRRDFQRIYDSGRRAVGPHLVVFALLEGAGGPADETVGVVASRKVGGAVARARAKRVLRAAHREVQPRLPQGWRIILVARRALITDGVRSHELLPELEGLLERIGCLSGVES